jgi:hypothetical protein
MEKILFYIKTDQFGVNDFLGYKSLKDFYNTTLTSINYSSNLHPLNPLKTVLVADATGDELLNSVQFGERKVVDAPYNVVDLFENEFPALWVKTTVIPFYDIPLNLYNAKLLCFNGHWNRESDREAAAYGLSILHKKVLNFARIKKIARLFKEENLYSLNTAILGSADKNFFRKFAEDVKELMKDCEKINNEPLFFQFIENVYLYYYAEDLGIKIETVNPYIPEHDYTNFKYFLTERLCIYIVGDKQNELTMNAIANISNKNLISK